MNWPIWHTCLNCPPHGMADHSLYGDKKCLLKVGDADCPCPGYVPDEKKPIKRLKSTTKIDTPLPRRSD